MDYHDIDSLIHLLPFLLTLMFFHKSMFWWKLIVKQTLNLMLKWKRFYQVLICWQRSIGSHNIICGMVVSFVVVSQQRFLSNVWQSPSMILSLSNILKIVIDSILLLLNNWQPMSSTKQTTNKNINQGHRKREFISTKDWRGSFF